MQNSQKSKYLVKKSNSKFKMKSISNNYRKIELKFHALEKIE